MPLPATMRETNAPPQPMGVYKGYFGKVQAQRLLDRAAFGARPGEVEKLRKMGMRRAVYSLTRPQGPARLKGPKPHDDGGAIDMNEWNHQDIPWLDRMVRSNQPLKERMTLLFHDWFATSNSDVNQIPLMYKQIALFRKHAFGDFRQLTLDITKDPAMLEWLDGTSNNKWWPNENYARELMELFTLGADRGAYTEDDVRNLARALTGFRATWNEKIGRVVDFRYDPSYHDNNNKTIFGKTGNYSWQDGVNLCIDHPLHASFFVNKLWSYFVGGPPSQSTLNALVNLYKKDNQIRPVLEAILMHPDFYLGPRITKSPVVFLVSMLKAKNRYITQSWKWPLSLCGQELFYPPNVAGWKDDKWLDTSTLRARWLLVTYIQQRGYYDPWKQNNKEEYKYPARENPEQAFLKAYRYWGSRPMTQKHQQDILNFAKQALPRQLEDWEQAPVRAIRQNALMHLIPISPDYQLM